VDGGLKHKSDLDILVIIEREITDQERKQLAQNFLNISVPIGHATARALEITILEKGSITNKNHPYTYQLQYGEWLREELLKGELLYSQSD
ncbi:adenylyltransferase, partial [Acinetobacter baumannii]